MTEELRNIAIGAVIAAAICALAYTQGNSLWTIAFFPTFLGLGVMIVDSFTPRYENPKGYIRPLLGRPLVLFTLLVLAGTVLLIKAIAP